MTFPGLDHPVLLAGSPGYGCNRQTLDFFRFSSRASQIIAIEAPK